MLFLLFAVWPAYSQFFSIGVKAGLPVTDAYSVASTGYAAASSYNRDYIIGPTAEVHLPFRLSFEADALYRRNGVNYYMAGVPTGNGSITKIAVNDWQVPLLGKYELASGPIRPFVDAGIVYRHVSTSQTGILTLLDHPNGVGFAVGGGITLKLLLLRVSPEIRYTHWSTRPFDNSMLLAQSNANQADFLVGFTF